MIQTLEQVEVIPCGKRHEYGNEKIPSRRFGFNVAQCVINCVFHRAGINLKCAHIDFEFEGDHALDVVHHSLSHVRDGEARGELEERLEILEAINIAHDRIVGLFGKLGVLPKTTDSFGNSIIGQIKEGLQVAYSYDQRIYSQLMDLLSRIGQVSSTPWPSGKGSYEDGDFHRLPMTVESSGSTDIDNIILRVRFRSRWFVQDGTFLGENDRTDQLISERYEQFLSDLRQELKK